MAGRAKEANALIVSMRSGVGRRWPPLGSQRVDGTIAGLPDKSANCRRGCGANCITLSDEGSRRERARSRRYRHGNLVSPDGWLAARRTGCSASGHSRSQRPCQRSGSAGERAHSPRRAWLSLHRAVSGCDGPVSREDRASRPVQEALPRVPSSGRRAGPRCQAAARASPALALRAAFDQAQPGRHRRLSAWRSIASSSGSAPIARTSCAQRQAAAILAAHRSASSREGTSRSVNPPMACGHRRGRR